MYQLSLLLAICVSVSRGSPLLAAQSSQDDETTTNNATYSSTTAISVSLSSIDDLGLTEDLLQLLTINLQKAIAKEKDEQEIQRFRQGGGIGDFFGLGGGGAGGAGGAGGQGLAGEEEDEDDEEASTIQGPGPFGVLSGLYGIFSGLGSLNPRRVVASTVNFFPPDQRAAAQAALDMIFGVQNVTTLAPLTNAPAIIRTTPKPLTPANAALTNGTAASSPAANVRVNNNNSSSAGLSTLKPPSVLGNSSSSLQEDEPQDNIPSLSLENEFSNTAEMLFKTSVHDTESPAALEESTTVNVPPVSSTEKPYTGVQNVSEIIVRVA